MKKIIKEAIRQEVVSKEKPYKHWLKIDGLWETKNIIKAYKNLKKYLTKYPKSKITQYLSNRMMFDRYLCLECEQNYIDLDLDCNSSFDGSLIHLKGRPVMITQSKRTFKEIYTYVISTK